MKNIFYINQKRLLITLIVFSVVACKSESKKEQVFKNEEIVNTVDSSNFDNIKGKLFSFQPTNDSKFCDLSKIIETDCGIGYFYFNNKNKITFTFECVGDTSIVYFLGSYKKDKNSLKCHFDYSYECFFDSIDDKFMGKGNLVSKKDWFDIEVLVSNCPETYGYIGEYADSKDKAYYLIQRANKRQSEIFWNFFKTSKVKAEYL
ncbi:MAG: hypothetical protein V4622_07990 [Bacteroidota bacterium]